jgi:hypothetical protein
VIKRRLDGAPHQAVEVASTVESPYDFKAAHQAPVDEDLGHRSTSGRPGGRHRKLVIARHFDHLEGIALTPQQALGPSAVRAGGPDVDHDSLLVHLWFPLTSPFS